jgi:hypothetical protein
MRRGHVGEEVFSIALLTEKKKKPERLCVSGDL